jgi:hypothetical protein
MSMFLDRNEIARLTGKTTRPAQIRELIRRRIRHEVNALGDIVIARAHIEQRLGVERPALKESDGFAEPDFSVFEKKRSVKGA